MADGKWTMENSMQRVLTKSILFLVVLIVIGAFLRLYNLNWGAPYYFHPDERNIASSVSQLHLPDHMNPNFFAYGSLPIYTIYFLGAFNNTLSSCQSESCHVSFEQAIIISRSISAILSIALIPLIFFIGKKVYNETAGLIAAFFTATSVGLIQFAHFGTFEIWLTFFSALLFYLLLKLIDKTNTTNALAVGAVLGILFSIKVSMFILFPLPILALLFTKKKLLTITIRIGIAIKFSLLILLTALCVYFLTNPYVALSTKAFQDSMQYESQVALGTLPVFYSGSFYNTIPILYQFVHVYPFLLNPLLTALFIPAFLYLAITTYKTTKVFYVLLVTCYLLLFLSQASLFVKWGRYIIPTLPFVYLIIAVVLERFFSYLLMKYYHQNLKHITLIIIFFICSIFTLSYALTAFVQKDTRLQGALWAKEHISRDAKIISEVYDLGITAFNPFFEKIALFNFYDLDSPVALETKQRLETILSTNEYIILPSQRILQPRLQNKKAFPNGHEFYKNLFTNKTQFTKIYQSPCDIFCHITYLGDPIFSFEQTTSVFDRPTVIIYRKNEYR